MRPSPSSVVLTAATAALCATATLVCAQPASAPGTSPGTSPTVPRALFPESDSAFVRANYVKHEYRVPMRDGVQLFTVVYAPRDAGAATRYPIVMQRTCYSVAPYGPDAYAPTIGPDPFMLRDKYIFVYQDVRGRYESGGTFLNVRPFVADSIKAHDPKAVDEASDTYDTIDWLLKNLPGNNGRVGQWGISYPGFYTSMGALSRHPALVASSPQAPVTDFYFEDFHHNGALTQGYFYAYPLFGIPTGGPRHDNWWQPRMVMQGHDDDYDFQLGLGPLRATTDRYYRDNLFWQEIIQHPDYDAFWQARAVPPHLTGIKHAVMTVGGWFDAEDLYGPLAVYKTIERNSPGTYNTIVEGPFRHGGWARQGVEHTIHGDLYFGDSLETKFQRDVEAVFFRHWLKGPADGHTGLPDALMFDTGRKEWRGFDAWPARTARLRSYYLTTSGGLSTTPPTAASGSSAFREYVSDPARPVPSRCLAPTIQGLTMYQYMSDDQRCFDERRDVLTFVTDTLREDVTLGGEITARLKAATTGRDADYVVKLIDVYPMSEPDHPYMPYKNVHLAGYQQLVRGEIMRARYRHGFARPTPMTPGAVEDVTFRLQDVLHTFRKGHRMMVQVQSSWFPAFDRNPQTYVPNIYEARASDFVAATERIYTSGANASRVDVQVLP
ncbi:MAG TPA: CocE/NonD family hydrolase [Gemmatirosa sp.]